MNKSKIIKDTIIFAKSVLSKEGTGHDFYHIERVRNNAKTIMKKEKADIFIVDLAILLHDIGDRKVIGKKDDDYTIAENHLIYSKIPQEIIEKVMFIIKNMSFSKSLDKNKIKVTQELKVVQDADRLDALGAIGIARLFSYGGSKGRLMYDTKEKVKKFSSRKSYITSQGSSFNHFYEKILHLRNLMNTATGKQMALKRHKYVENYIKEFLSELGGKK